MKHQLHDSLDARLINKTPKVLGNGCTDISDCIQHALATFDLSLFDAISGDHEDAHPKDPHAHVHVHVHLQHRALAILSRIVRIKPLDNALSIAEALIMKLVDADPHTRTLALALCLALTTTPDKVHLPFDQISIQHLALSFLDDDHGGVRVASLKALYHLHLMDMYLQPEYYRKISKLTRDDDEPDVRMQAMTMLWAIAHKYPDYDLDASRNGIALWTIENDAFMRFCEMAMDSEEHIRAKAMNYIGTFRHVREAFILQTLSKQSITSFKRPAPQVQVMVRVGKDVDYIDNNERLIEISACGAFIHGLEDQYPIVRNAAIDAMCELSCQASNSARFAEGVVTFLIDMFNDEDETVRQNAVSSLFKLSHEKKVILNLKELESLKLILQDAQPSVRQSALDMLGNVVVDTVQTFTKLHMLMVNHIGQRALDRDFVYRCLKKLGQSHPIFVRALLNTMFALDDRYIAQEKFMDEPSHVGNVILTYNAMSVAQSLSLDLPSYILRHYPYYRDSFPDCVPDFDLEAIVRPASLKQTWDTSGSQIQSYLQQCEDMLSGILELIRKPTGLSLESARSMLRSLQDRVDDTSTLGVKAISGSTCFFSHILSGYEAIVVAKLACTLLTPADTLRRSSYRIMSATYKLHALFLGVPVQAPSSLWTLRVYAHALWVYASISDSKESGYSTSQGEVTELIERAQEQLQTCEGDDTSGEFVESLLTLSSFTVVKSLREAIVNAAIPSIKLADLVRNAYALVKSPIAGEYIQRQYEMSFIVSLYNVTDTGTIRIDVIISNGRQSYRPPSSTFSIVSSFEQTCHVKVPIAIPGNGVGPYPAKKGPERLTPLLTLSMGV
ncbi:hypothetical protein SeMB42_g00699 [Synchytrium endobioticum]|uniref:Condensin complex subunit 1 C-terminal domain-containing protein n=1 Tax=Synchytrium endobioticum TaxID=286115 RepID=A0A507DPF3_9FUNG|nr:hypothetical protein SeLEV6574_g02137 [Synchytrium endobioticum]TPX53599.1 hypothetical protein SeMB42_g00699 [Synchytrium endobioticum]